MVAAPFKVSEKFKDKWVQVTPETPRNPNSMYAPDGRWSSPHEKLKGQILKVIGFDDDHAVVSVEVSGELRQKLNLGYSNIEFCSSWLITVDGPKAAHQSQALQEHNEQLEKLHKQRDEGLHLWMAHLGFSVKKPAEPIIVAPSSPSSAGPLHQFKERDVVYLKPDISQLALQIRAAALLTTPTPGVGSELQLSKFAKYQPRSKYVFRITQPSPSKYRSGFQVLGLAVYDYVSNRYETTINNVYNDMVDLQPPK